MTNELIAKIYIKALLKDSNKDNIASYIKSLNGVAILFTNSKFNEIISSPFVKKSEKIDILTSSLKDKKIINLIKLLGEHNRFELIPELKSGLELELSNINNSYDGIIHTDSKLTNKEITTLEKQFGTKFNIKLKLTQKMSKNNSIKVDIESLGLEVGFSTERLKSQIKDSILKAI